MAAHETPANLRMPEDGEVHVWSARVSELRLTLALFHRLLSPPEQQSAERYVRSSDRERYIAAHGLLRNLLGRYLKVAPDKVEFTANEFGKPELASAAVPPLRFNMTHSGDAILYAVTLRRRVGIDVEQIRADLDVMELATSQFTGVEVDVLQALSNDERCEAFFRCWTRKEAYLKARGEGLGISLKKFAVSFGRAEPPRICWSEDDPEAAKRWTMFHLVTYPEYVGAVVVEGQQPVQMISMPGALSVG